MNKRFFSRFSIGAALLLASGLRYFAATPSSTEQVLHSHIFATPLEWVSSTAPSEADSSMLLGASDVFKSSGTKAGLLALEQFVASYPASPWTPSVEVNLAEHYRRIGRYTSALRYWEAAWDATKASQDYSGRVLAARALAGWTRLLASLGERDRLNQIFAEADALHLSLGIHAATIRETREGLAVMSGHPELSYRCGSFALGHVARAMGLSSKIVHGLFQAQSPDGGFSISELLNMAQTNGMAMEAVRPLAGAELVVPSVVHWRLNHYAAIVEKKGNFYRVEDPTFEHVNWIDAETIAAEAGGEFLIPKSKVPAGWVEISSVECNSIYGKGYPNLFDDSDDDGPDDGCGDDEGDNQDTQCPIPASNDGSSSGNNPPPPPTCCDGMTTWSVTEPYITLWLQDVPLFYHQGDGSRMQLKLSYKHRSAAQQDTSFSGFGDKWSCNWLGMLETYNTGAPASEHLAGGGVRSFATDGTLDYKSLRAMVWSLISGSPLPTLLAARGSANVYGAPVSSGTGSTNNYLTERLDRYGRVLEKFGYGLVSGVTQLTNVTDIDGRSCTLTYGDSVHPYLITAVTDPYGRTARFYYDFTLNANGLLTNILDAQGLNSYFQYDGNENITNLTTPYGPTAFAYSDTIDTNDLNAVERSLLITEASGDKQLYVYRDDAPSGVSIPCAGDPYPTYRLSFHWNRSQYQSITSAGKSNVWSMVATDYQNASVKHWLHQELGSSQGVSDTMDSMADPFDPVLNTRPNCVQYSYPGQSNTAFIGSMKRVSAIYTGGSHAMDITRNSLGRPTSYVYYNTTGPNAVYTNIYNSSGTILLYEKGPRGELTRGYGYDPVHTNLLVTVTNAVGDVIRYTYDSSTLKLTSIAFPTQLVRTNIYYASGTNAGFLEIQADLNVRTNSFSYASGNVLIQTNELGLIITNTWDKLNRLTSVAYPDGTVSNVYNNLDLVATKDRLNQWTHYVYNNIRQLTYVTNVNNQVTSYSYCGCGSPSQITRWYGSRALTTSLQYDQSGRLYVATYPDGYQLTYSYDNLNRPTTITDGGGVQLGLTEYFQSGLKSQVSKVTLGGLYILQRGFDEYARIISSVDRNQTSVTNDFDFIDRITARQALNSNSGDQSGLEQFTYDARGLETYIDQRGQTTTFSRDSASRVLYETNADHQLLQFTYNPADQLLTLTDGKNQTTSWTYDSFGRLTNKVESGSQLFSYGYDPADRLTNRTSAAKGATIYRYDPIGNLTNIDYSGGTTPTTNISLAFDPLNRLTNMVDAIGNTAFTWTDGNQLSSEAGPWLDDTITYVYTNRMRASLSMIQPNASPWVQNYGYDTLMRLSALSSPAGTFSYTYPGAAAHYQQLTFPTGAYVYNNYDGLGRLFLSQLLSLGVLVDSHQYTYDSGSLVTQQSFVNNNYANYSYDGLGQLTNMSGFEPAGAPRMNEQFAYVYDDAWNLSYLTNNDLDETFAVNNLNELTTVGRGSKMTVAGTSTGPASSVNVSGTGISGSQAASLYSDNTWALAGVTPANGQNTFTAAATDSYGRTSQDNVTVNLPSSSSFSYDANGNLLSDGNRNFAYDDENQLTSVWVTNNWRSDFVYDALMRRRLWFESSWNGSSWVTNTVVRYVYDRMLVLQERYFDPKPVATIPRQNVTYTRGADLSFTFDAAGGIGGLLARSDSSFAGSPNANTFYGYDGNGNVTCILDQSNNVAARYAYDSFGNVLSESGSLAGANIYRFSTKEWHQGSGLTYFGLRFYDAALHRWMNRDPIEETGGLNLYAFIENDPLNKIDPFGEEVPAADSVDANPSLAADLEMQEQGLNSKCFNLRSRLARNLAKAERAVKQGDRAHHIIAQADKRAEAARKVLAKFKINVDDAANGVGLPNKFHQALHTNKYYDYINELAKTWKTREDAIKGLQKVAEELKQLSSCPAK